MRETLDDLTLPITNEMARYFEWSEEEKQAHLDELAAVLAENDLKELKNNAK